MGRKKTNGDGIGAVDLGRSVGEVITRIVLGSGGTVQDLQRILDDPELQRRIAHTVIHTELPKNHYWMHVTYTPMPSLKEIRKAWHGYVSDSFDGRPFTLHPSCVGMDCTPGMRMFYLYRPHHSWRKEEQIARAASLRTKVAPNGYRPAIHTETYEFANVYPSFANFVGPGSSVMGDHRKYPGVVEVVQYRSQEGRTLHDASHDEPHLRDTYGGKTGILLVAK